MSEVYAMDNGPVNTEIPAISHGGRGINDLKGVSLFCGAGGMDMGFHNAGFDVVWANDFYRDACDTYAGWSGATVICEDITKIEAGSIPDADFMTFGFPCQGFSLSGPRKLDDSRNRLYHECVRIVKAKRPFFFVAENVKGLLSMGGGSIFEAILADFGNCGYNVFYKLLNAKDYGVPQDRERVVIIGFRKDLGIVDADDYAFPEPCPDVMTIRDAISNINPLTSDICFAPYSSRYMSRNRRRDWDDVSFTIPAMAKQVPLHPGSPLMHKLGADLWEFGKGGVTRRLSWQECAAIQTFPDGMWFCGDLTSKYKQIGNAVPVKLAQAVAESIKTALLSGGGD